MTRLFDLPAGKIHELLLSLQRAEFTLEDANDVISDPSRAKLIVETLRSNSSASGEPTFRHSSMLRSLTEQKELLLQLNERLPEEHRLPTDWITQLDTSSDHVQSVEDLEFFFVVPGTLEETWHFNRALVLLENPGVGKSYSFSLDEMPLRLDPTGVEYKPGIHRVRINLVDGWTPESEMGVSVEEARQNAYRSGKKLAGIEVLAAYGLHPGLLNLSCRSEDMPGFNLAGLQLCGSRDSYCLVPSLNWRKDARRVVLTFRRASDETSNDGFVDSVSVAPSLIT